jgi:4-hydroxy-3-polyprenylbenzoate decarboxylase
MIRRYVVGLTGASGAAYGLALIRELVERPVEVHVIRSRAGRRVMARELGLAGPVMDHLAADESFKPHPQARLIEHPADDIGAPPASGSFRHQGMVVVPCSMRTLAAISSGLADNLVTRAADVCLKEKRPLILVPRETPLGLIHLNNMVRAAQAGAVILPPSPAFYHGPQTIQDLVRFIVARILDQLGLEHQLVEEWSGDGGL